MVLLVTKKTYFLSLCYGKELPMLRDPNLKLRIGRYLHNHYGISSQYDSSRYDLVVVKVKVLSSLYKPLVPLSDSNNLHRPDQHCFLLLAPKNLTSYTMSTNDNITPTTTTSEPSSFPTATENHEDTAPVLHLTSDEPVPRILFEEARWVRSPAPSPTPEREEDPEVLRTQKEESERVEGWLEEASPVLPPTSDENASSTLFDVRSAAPSPTPKRQEETRRLRKQKEEIKRFERWLKKTETALEGRDRDRDRDMALKRGVDRWSRGEMEGERVYNEGAVCGKRKRAAGYKLIC
jgi:hypothetical protein